MERNGAQAADIDGIGLRERKKIATREALAKAALDLALRDGPESVRVPDIAAEVGVSPRTFNNYFSSVPEAICALPAERALRVAEVLRQRPASESLAEAITNALLEDHNDSEEGRAFVRMIITTPMLRGEFFKTVQAREQAFAQAIAERVQPPGGDLNPQLLAAAYFGMARVVGHRWMCEQDGDFTGLLQTGLALLAPAADAYQRALDQGRGAAADCPPPGQSAAGQPSAGQPPAGQAAAGGRVPAGAGLTRRNSPQHAA